MLCTRTKTANQKTAYIIISDWTVLEYDYEDHTQQSYVKDTDTVRFGGVFMGGGRGRKGFVFVFFFCVFF